MLRSTSVVGPLALALALAACNDPPTDAGVRIDPEAPTTVDDLVLQIFEPSVDEQGHAISYQITWTVDGAAASEFDGLQTIPASATARDQVWEVTVLPVDEKDDAGNASVATTTVLNTAPALLSSTYAPAEPRTEDDLTVRPDIEDVDSDSFTVAHAWTVNGTAAGTDSDTLAASTFEKGDVVGLTLTLSDDTDSSEHQLPTVTIGNTAPSVDSAALAPDVIRVADTVSVVPAGWMDADGDAEGYRYAWTVSGSDGGFEPTLSGSFKKGDRLQCTLTPFDGDDEGDPVVTPEVTVVNTAPVIAQVDLDTTAPKADEDVTATAVGAVDADADPVELTFVWTVDGREARTTTKTTTTDTLPSKLYGKGQLVVVTVTPNDGEEDGAPVSSETATVANSAPVMVSAVLAPDPAGTADDLTVTAEATDLDGDTISYGYAWTVNGSSVSSSSSTLGSSNFVKGDKVAVSVTALDGDDTSVPLVAGPLTIVNTPPTDPVVGLGPSAPRSTEDLTCSLTTPSTDADADRITYTYTWYRGGSSYSATSTTATSVTLSSSATADGDNWECRVSASDGTASSATVASSTVTVSDWTGIRTFTTCGQTSTTGPSSSQCSSEYSGTTLAGEVTVSAGIQAWTVPYTGTYRIEGYGARGGGLGPGKGARVRGDFALKKGDTLYVIVGQTGNTSNQTGYPYVGGGGGASFVYTNVMATTPLLVAAGGGGGAESCGTTPVYGGDGSATTTPTDTATSGTNQGTGNGAGGTGGNGGKRGVDIGSFSTGAGGGGWLTDGEDGQTIRSPGGEGGEAPRNGAVGGLFGHTSYNFADGGFGGGGGASDNTGTGGGGGGYNGGGGGNNYAGGCPARWGAGGGGGSYNAGSNASATTGANSAAGKVTIDLL